MANLLSSFGSFFTKDLPKVGNWFSSPGGKGALDIAGLGATGLGLIGNMQTDAQRAKAAALAEANAKLTPQQLSSMVTGATQPLSAALVQGVTGNVNANLAEQGLSEAPGLIATATSQALAPYELQNQQQALQLVMQKLGLPAEFARTIPPNANLAPLLALLQHSFGTPSTPGIKPPTPSPATPSPNTDSANWNLGDWNTPTDTSDTNSYPY